MAIKDRTGSSVIIACACAAALFAGIYVGVLRPLILQSELSGIVSVKPAEKVVAVTGVTLEQSTAKLKVGDTLPLKVKVMPEDAATKDVTWESSDTKIAIVNKEGVVTALKTGKTTITVTTKDGGFTAKCEITVKNPITGVSINPKKVTVGVGKSVTLKAGVFPYDADQKDVELVWSSNNSAVASVDQKGVVTGVKAGTATITLSTKDGEHTATCSVKVAIPVSGISLNKSEAKLAVGDTLKLVPTIKPETAAVKSIKWETSDKAVATIDNTGTVTAVKPGTATITVTTKDGGHKATCKVTVLVPVKQITLDKTSAELAVGKTLTLTATVSPSNATDKSVKWTSSDSSVATVNEKGVVTAVKAGTATITASSKGGAKDADIKATCAITVTASVKGVSLDRSEVSLGSGESVTLKATISPSDATKKDVTWSSSDSSVASVDSGGKVTAGKAGTATITVTTVDGGFKATCTVKVTAHVTGVSLDRGEATIEVGQSVTLVATVSPAEAPKCGVSWSSSDSSIASVEGGRVTAKKPGTATITVVTDEGGHTASCKVTVPAHVSGVSLDRSDVTLDAGQGVTLVATVSPADATNRGVSWTSSDSSIASVDGSGNVTAKAKGSATITVTTNEGGYYASCKVQVTATTSVTGVSLDASDVTLDVGDGFRLTATVSPSDADNRGVSWSSSDSSVAGVDGDGYVTAKGKGSATITVRTDDGGYADSCTVCVNQPVSGVSLDMSEASLPVGDGFQLSASVSPSNASSKGVSWGSSNNKVATVDGDGYVVAKGEGSCSITVTTDDGGYQTSCSVTVFVPAPEISLDQDDVTIKVGQSFSLKASTSSSTGVSWSSSDSKIATVDGEGNVTGKKEGKVTITATADVGGNSASCEVRVTK